MKLTDFKVRAPRGTYYGAHPTIETRHAILDFLDENNIPNAIASNLLHCTICYSHIWCVEKALGDLDPHWQGQFEAYNVWPSTPKENEQPTNCLTLSFICPEMVERHQHLRRNGATHNFPEFKPHMTLSYDVENDFDHHALSHYSGPLHFHHEYSEPLNVEFVKTKVNKEG